MERQAGRRVAVCRSVARGLGASQSFGLRRQASWPKVWRGGRVQIQRDGTGTQAERRPGEHGMEADRFGHGFRAVENYKIALPTNLYAVEMRFLKSQ